VLASAWKKLGGKFWGASGPRPTAGGLRQKILLKVI